MSPSEEEFKPYQQHRARVQPVISEQACRTEECEMELNIGVFMDGTGNNWEWIEEGQTLTQQQRQKDSNVYRLFKAYPDDAYRGFFRIYVPGVGTPFEKIGDDDPGALGGGTGAGGDGRINFALLQVLNSIRRLISNDSKRQFEDDTIKALCRNGKRRYDSHGNPMPWPKGDAPSLQRVGMEKDGGLLRDPRDAQRRTFFREQCGELAQIVAVGKPRIKRIVLDVFGFSRGAAHARVFCTWLAEIMEGDTLCGVPAEVRFLGVFDTVASVGLPNSVPGANGHFDWATPENLKIGAHVKRCVHYVAMHEQRASFPLDTVRNPDGSMPGHCHQWAFPGMHSDVGGGYTPDEQGRGPQQLNSQKLSQLALNNMYEAAQQALVPLDKELARESSVDGDYDPFDIDPSLRQAYVDFMSESGTQSRRLRDWLLPYVSWRYQLKDRYVQLPWASRTKVEDELTALRDANEGFLDDLALFEAPKATAARDVAKYGVTLGTLNQIRRRAQLEEEASEVFEYVRKAAPVSPRIAALFADYVHDSYGGFTLVAGKHEPAGYLRYRRQYHGTSNALTWREDTERDDVRLA